MIEWMFLNRIFMGYNFSFLNFYVGHWIWIKCNIKLKFQDNLEKLDHFRSFWSAAGLEAEWVESFFNSPGRWIQLSDGQDQRGRCLELCCCKFWLGPAVDKWTPGEDWKLKPASSNCSHQSLWCPLGVNKQPGHLIHRLCLRVCGQRAWRVCQGGTSVVASLTSANGTPSERRQNSFFTTTIAIAVKAGFLAIHSDRGLESCQAT